MIVQFAEVGVRWVRQKFDVVVDVAIVGAQKAGTTWLARSLDQHPNISLVQGKEAHFFDSSEVQQRGLSPEEISRRFPDAVEGNLLLDATPSYLYLGGSLEALHRHNPGVKVIAIIRDPGQRAISQFYHSQRLGFESRSLVLALLSERTRLARETSDVASSEFAMRHWSYRDRGRYESQVLNLLRLFPNALVLPFPKMVKHPDIILKNVQNFLGVPEIQIPILPPQNSFGGQPRHPWLGSLLSWSLRSDTQSVTKLLGWNPRELNEGSL